MAIGKERFQQAIRESFDRLCQSGEKKITKTKVINNAKFEDGTFVGKTTLYAKNRSTQEFIHAELLEELDGKIENIEAGNAKKERKKTTTDLHSEQKKEIKELKKKNNQLLVQIIELEDSFENTAYRNDANQIRDLELNLYIISTLLSCQIGSKYKEVDEIRKKFETKYHGTEILKFTKEKIQKMKNDIECSRIISISESFKDSK